MHHNNLNNQWSPESPWVKQDISSPCSTQSTASLTFSDLVSHPIPSPRLVTRGDTAQSSLDRPDSQLSCRGVQITSETCLGSVQEPGRHESRSCAGMRVRRVWLDLTRSGGGLIGEVWGQGLQCLIDLFGWLVMDWFFRDAWLGVFLLFLACFEERLVRI